MRFQIAMTVATSAVLLSSGCGVDEDDVNTVPLTGAALGGKLLEDRDVAGARAVYIETATANPDDLQAQFGAAFTRAALLLENRAIDDALAACGEPGFDIQGQIFGPNGSLAHEDRHKRGSSTLAFERGSNPMTLQPSGFQPDAIYSNYSTWDAGADINVEVIDNRAGPNDERTELSFWIDPANPTWHDGASFDIPSVDFDISLWVDQNAGSNAPSSSSIRPVSGTVVVTQAPTADGGALEVRLQSVLFHRVSYDGIGESVIEVFEISGVIKDTLMAEFEPALGSIPFMDLEWIDGPPERPIHVQMIEACGAGMSLTYLQSQIDIFFDEVRAIRGHLDIIANSPQANGFVWNLPVGVLANSVEIPIGITEVHLLRAAIHVWEAGNDIFQQYNLLGTDFIDLISVLSPYYDQNCWENCPNISSRVDFDPLKLGIDLNLNFLTPAQGTLDMSNAKTSFQAALFAAKDALFAQPTANVLLNFQKPGAVAASNEIAGLLDLLLASADSPQALDETPEWILHPSEFFSNPFDRASLLADTGLAALFDITGPVSTPGLEQNGEVNLKEAVVDAIIEKFVTMPAQPTTTTYCVLDADCPNPFACTGWSDLGGVCYADMATPCSWDGDCGSSWCVIDTCDARDPVFFNYDIVDAAFSADPPAFLNGTLADELSTAW